MYNNTWLYSLTFATSLFVDTYNKQDCEKIEIKKYNSHKIRHTFWVLEIGRGLLIKIQKNKTLDKEIMNKAEICFILHDLWRLYQNDWKKILENTQFDHWDKSYEIVKDNNYSLDICLAIKYHNKFTVDLIYKDKEYLDMSKKEQEKTFFLLQVLRDADKLQNMMFSIFDYNKFDLNYFDKTVNIINWDLSDGNIEDIEVWKLIKKSNIHTLSDYMMFQVCFLFDMNFKESYRILSFYNYFDDILSRLKENKFLSKGNFEVIKDMLEKYKKI